MRKLFIILIPVTLHYAAWTGEAADDDYVVATVGEEKIFFSEIEQTTQGLNRFLKENFQTSKDWRLNYINQYVARLALTKRAVREGLDKDRDVLFATEQARRDILSGKILADRLADISITEEDLKKYYEQNKERYQFPERVKLSYIKLRGGEDADKTTARLNKGESFEKIGKRDIVKVGDWLQRDAPTMNTELAGLPVEALKPVFLLGVGGTSEPIVVASPEAIPEIARPVPSEAGKSPRGDAHDAPRAAQDVYYIFHLDEKEPAKDRPFAEVRQQVEFEYSKSVRDKAINEFIVETFGREKAEVYEKAIGERMS